MRFCDNCNNILVPRNKKLYCKACDEEFELDQEEQKEYKIVKTIKHDDKETAPIIIRESMKENRISAQERKAFEDFFAGSEQDGY